MAAVMQVTNLRVDVAGKTLLELPALELPATGVTGLVGQNGSGKSTLLRILARQQSPSQGDVRYDGRRLSDWGVREFARRVAYLPQQTPLAAGLTARELVALGRYPWHGALGRFLAQDAARVDEALVATETIGLADRFVDSLSGGERQRVWLAMLLAQNADLLLLDEPISALDPAHQTSVLSLIGRISRDNTVAVLVVLHDVNLAARYCDYLIALKRGRLIAAGAPADIMSSEQLSTVYDVDMGVFPNPDTDGVIAYVRT